MEWTRVIKGEVERHGCGEKARVTAASVPILGLSPTPPADVIFPGSSIPIHIAPS